MKCTFLSFLKDMFLKVCLYISWHLCLRFFQWFLLFTSLLQQVSVTTQGLLASANSSSTPRQSHLYVVMPLALSQGWWRAGSFPCLNLELPTLPGWSCQAINCCQARRGTFLPLGVSDPTWPPCATVMPVEVITYLDILQQMTLANQSWIIYI